MPRNQKQNVPLVAASKRNPRFNRIIGCGQSGAASGGGMMAAKLAAARRLGVPVVLIRRPPLPPGVPTVATVEEAVAWVRAR